MSSRVLLFVLTSALALVLGLWTFSPHQAVAIVRHGGYWWVATACVLFTVIFGRSVRHVRIDWRSWRRWPGPVLITALATVFLHVHENHEYKIVADEVVLGLTAKEMHFSRDASVAVRGYEYAGNFTSMVNYVDKRPLLFPFLLSLTHDLSGFRVDNVFYLNAALSAAMMALL